MGVKWRWWELGSEMHLMMNVQHVETNESREVRLVRTESGLLKLN